MSLKKKRPKYNLSYDDQLNYLFRKRVNFKNRTLTISGELDEDIFCLVDAVLSEFEARPKLPVTIRINSAGGSIYDALAIVGRMKKSKCKIITEGYGKVMSAATLILAAGDTRRMSRYGWAMVHEASYSTSGKHSQVKNYVAQSEREEKDWAKWMETFTAIPAKFWRKHGPVDTYFDPDELKNLGVIDVIF